MDMPAIIKTLGRGKSGSRDLTFDEAHFAMTSILDGSIEDLQLGAFLMLLRVKEETAFEIAGMVSACHDYLKINDSITVDINWPCYAGKKRQPSWYILAAMLLAQNNYSILMHGGGQHTANRQYAESVCAFFKLPMANNLEQAASQIQKQNFSYIALKTINPTLSKLIDLKFVLGLRSPANTLVRHITPFNARLSLQSMFHPAYQTLHHDTAALLNQPNNLVLKGDSGEFEVRPDSETSIAIQGFRPVVPDFLPKSLKQRAVRPEQPNLQDLKALWQGQSQNKYGEHAVINTTAIVYAKLESIPYGEARATVTGWWNKRA